MPVNNTYKRQNYISHILLMLLALIISPYVALKLTSLSGLLIEKILVSRGGIFALGFFMVSIFVFSLWAVLLIKRRYLQALAVQILMLPFSYYAQLAYSVSAYEITGVYVQKISLTTFFILAFFIVLSLRKELRRGVAELIYFERCLLAFALFATGSQLMNHSLKSAILLSLVGAWQFVALYYILKTCVTKNEDFQFLLKMVIWAVLIGIVARIGYTGQGYFIESGSSFGYFRLGQGPFGWAQSYGGYLSFIVLLSMYFIQSQDSIWGKVLWSGIVVILLFEMLNTFTRGAVLELSFALLLLYWRETRKFASKSIFTVGLLLFLIPSLGSAVLRLITARRLEVSLDYLRTESAITERINIFLQAIPHLFDKWGFGYGIGKGLYFSTASQGHAVVENVIFELFLSIGAIATLFFVLMLTISTWRLYKTSVSSAVKKKRLMAIYMLIALHGWFFFANTTSTSIIFYHHYEAIILFYTVMFLGVMLPAVDK